MTEFVMKNKIFGIFILFVNLAWIVFWCSLFLSYNFTSRIWFVIIPNWLLVFNVVLGFFGVAIGVKLVKIRIAIKHALYIEFPKFVIGLIMVLV